MRKLIATWILDHRESQVLVLGPYPALDTGGFFFAKMSAI